MEVMKKKKKEPLPHSPFVQKYIYGVNSEGFWNNHHTVIQFENITDVLKTLYIDTYQYIFFFDHSSGYDKSQPNGLNANNMNKIYCGGQSNMRNSKI